jgi:hypothetical protein
MPYISVMNTQVAVWGSGNGSIAAYAVGTEPHRMLVSIVQAYRGAPTVVIPTGVTHNAVAMTEKVDFRKGAGGQVGISLWYLLDAGGTGNITTTGLGVDANAGTRMVAYYLTPVFPTTPWRAATTANGNGTVSTVICACTGGDLAIDASAKGTTEAMTQGAGQTLISMGNGGGFLEAGNSSKDGALSTTFTWTWVNNRDWIASAIGVRPFAASRSRNLAYTYEIVNGRRVVRDANGAIVPPWRVRADSWAEVLRFFQPTTAESDTYIDDQAKVYFERVHWDGEDEGLDFETDRAQFSEVVLAQAAGGMNA